jgi:hypothetical protein
MQDLMIYDGVSLGANRCGIIVGTSGVEDKENLMCGVLTWSPDMRFQGFSLNCQLTRIEVLDLSSRTLIATTNRGNVMVARGHQITEEHVDFDNEGPVKHGYICGLKKIGGVVYAVGMGRQIYRRDLNRGWKPRGLAILQEDIENPLDIRGFQSIGGINEKEIYAVGWKGEIWMGGEGRNWERVDTATNLLLLGITVAPSGLVYVCGQNGLILRGRGHHWEILEQQDVEDDLTHIAYFRERIFVTGPLGLYRVHDDNTFESMVLSCPIARELRKLHIAGECLWAFGKTNMAWTEDAMTWMEVPLELDFLGSL